MDDPLQHPQTYTHASCDWQTVYGAPGTLLHGGPHGSLASSHRARAASPPSGGPPTPRTHQELTKGWALGRDFAGPEPATIIARADVAALPPPLQEFLDHAQRDPKAVGDLFSGPFLLVVRSQDSFPQIQRYRSHEQTLPQLFTDGYDFI